MFLSTLKTGAPDGQLIVVSSDHKTFVSATDVAPNLLSAIADWEQVAPKLQRLSDRLNAGNMIAMPVEPTTLAAPLPRTWQWLDGSAFEQHGALMQKAFNLPPIETEKPLMYQGMSDRFYGPYDSVPFPSEKDGIDFEGEFGVIVDEVPMGISAEDAAEHIKLIVMINDWSLRTIAPIEMKTGFGWVQAKPACSAAAFAATPDELGDAWKDGRVCLPLTIDWNGKRFGNASGDAMSVGFHELVAHAAATRRLVAGTIIGSGTVSNSDYATVGSSCISERRAIDQIDYNEVRTPFMSFGDRVKMECFTDDGKSLFGAIDQKVIAADSVTDQ